VRRLFPLVSFLDACGSDRAAPTRLEYYLTGSILTEAIFS
jgi:hypothetical protein